MGQPRRERCRDKADQAVQKELGYAAIRPARAVEKLGGEKRDHADNQHPDHPANARHVEQDVVYRPEHQAGQDAEQVAVLKRLEENQKQLCHPGQIGLVPISRHHGGRHQQQKAAEERTQRRENQISLHANPRAARFAPFVRYSSSAVNSNYVNLLR
jgi:hypothetical protein